MRGAIVLVAAALIGVLPSSLAEAEQPSTDVCVHAYVEGQVLRKAHRLLEAQKAFRTCVQTGCKDFIVADCTTWLSEVDASLPTLVPVAVDDRGNPLSGVRVLVDGMEFLPAIDGRSVDVEPGPHTFTFVAADGVKVEKPMLAVEGEKGVQVAVTFVRPRAPQTIATATETVPPEEQAVAAPTRASPWRTIGMGAAAVGVGGVAVGAIFGLLAIIQKNDAGCSAQSVCATRVAEDELAQAQRSGNAATALLVAGGALAVAGLATWSLAPIQAAPGVTVSLGGVAVGGKW